MQLKHQMEDEAHWWMHTAHMQIQKSRCFLKKWIWLAEKNRIKSKGKFETTDRKVAKEFMYS